MRRRALVLTIGLTTLVPGAILMTDHSATPTEKWAARVALLVLEANAGRGLQPDSLTYSMPPFGDSLGPDEVVDALARLPKPVLCKTSNQGRVLKLRCAAIGDGEIAGRTVAFGDDVGQQWTDLMRQACPEQSDPLVLVASSQNAAVVPFSSLKTFVRSYEIGHSLSWQNVHPGMLPQNVCALWTIGPPSKSHVELREQRP